MCFLLVYWYRYVLCFCDHQSPELLEATQFRMPFPTEMNFARTRSVLLLIFEPRILVHIFQMPFTTKTDLRTDALKMFFLNSDIAIP